MDRKLSRFLRRRGVTAAEIEQARVDGWLTLLAVDRLLLPGSRDLDRHTLAERAGVDAGVSERLWRALGFPDVPDDVKLFTEADVDALRVLMERRDNVLLDPDEPVEGIVNQTRAISAGLSRVAEVLSDQIAERVEAGAASGLDDEQLASLLVDALDWATLARLVDYALRLQVRAALWRKLFGATAEIASVPALAVGFVDLVGYTAISQELDAGELTALVARFEVLTHDTVAQLGGRLVKTIGDEVMFVADEPAIAAAIALRLTERTGDDDLLPDARAGLAAGSVLAREGDYYGPVVNLAHRLVELARPGTVVVSDTVHEALGDDPAYAWSRMRVRRIRDIGRVETWSLRAGERATAG